MTIELKHKFVSAKVDTLDASKIQPSNWNDTHELKLAGGVVVGRAAGAGQAAATELPMGAMGQTLIAAADAAAVRTAISADGTQAAIAAAAAKTPPVDADQFAILDSAAGSALKRVTWANIKAALKTYFDTLYVAVGGAITSSQNFISSTAAVVLAATGVGTVYLRPNGAGSTTGQAVLGSGGTLTLAGGLDAQQISKGGVALPVTVAFESAQQVMAAGGLVTVAHGLGVKPKMYQPYLVCVTAQANWSPGDELLAPIAQQMGGPDSRGINVWADATNIYARIGSDSGTPFAVLDKNTGGVNGVIIARWKLILRAWA